MQGDHWTVIYQRLRKMDDVCQYLLRKSEIIHCRIHVSMFADQEMTELICSQTTCTNKMKAMHTMHDRIYKIRRKIHGLRSVIPNPYSGNGTALRVVYFPGFEEHFLLTTNMPLDLPTIY
jgi:hypothetical protein